MNDTHDSIVITGLGVISAFGSHPENVWDALENVHNGRVKLNNYLNEFFTLENVSGIPIQNWNPEELLGKKGLQYMPLSAKYLMGAALLAVRDAWSEDQMPAPDQLGLVVGSNFAGVKTSVVFDHTTITEGPKYVSPMEAPNGLANSPASYLAIRIRSRACNTTISTGQNAGIDALGYAMNLLRNKRATSVIVGGVEELNSRVLWIYENSGLLPGKETDTAGVPFNSNSSGIVPGEGSAVAVLESRSEAEARGAHIYGELVSWGSSFSTDIRPERRANALERSITQVLQKSGLKKEEIRLIIASANGCNPQDRAEATALNNIFSEYQLPIMTVKETLGETFGAAGLFQLLSAVGVMTRGVVPPTVNLSPNTEHLNVLSGLSSTKRNLEMSGSNILLTSQDTFGSSSALLVRAT
ncbi:hypothetical protein D7Z26_12240 [Cohnella endophytica]|uniref:Ketosynthase family 3 (KS3) domain-containing protein n=1 Tax=Cohnella endophytica TaxID=2419778 RepID=A0A494XWT0_9BACL|nr:beta-ketoacyl synthase N-terminal-like domain-containing protein [Cohnella endophytica]RKP54144.1 hypothetical protein D7Z26_12240 [Cohnella endophytica]